MIGMLRYCSEEVAELSVRQIYLSGFWDCLEYPTSKHGETTLLPLEQVALEEEYQEQTLSVVPAYDKVQALWDACNRQLERAPGSSIYQPVQEETTRKHKTINEVLEPKSQKRGNHATGHDCGPNGKSSFYPGLNVSWCRRSHCTSIYATAECRKNLVMGLMT